jgi:hypothetical protein
MTGAIMRPSPARRAAHVLERIGLAMAGAAAGLLVGVHVGSSIPALTTQGFLAIVMIAGAAGYYLGIDKPPHRLHGFSTEIARGWSAGKISASELLTSVGTFLAALAAIVSITWVAFSSEPPLSWTVSIMAAWTAGTIMQIVAGAIARRRR